MRHRPLSTRLKRFTLLLSLGPLLEVAAYPKPGNVHRFRNFPDTRFEDFIVTGAVFVQQLYVAALRGSMGCCKRTTVGDVIFRIVDQSRRLHGGGNTCLGTATLLAPLAMALGRMLSGEEGEVDVRELVRKATALVRERSTPHDSVYFYRAVRAAAPSYLSKSDKTHGLPNVFDKKFRARLLGEGIRLWDVLRRSAEGDIVCREVVEGYRVSLDAASFLRKELAKGSDWNDAVVDTYLYVLSKTADTLVARKHGWDKARELSEKAARAIRLGGMKTIDGRRYVESLDSELAVAGINPGASADIVATAISLHAVQTPEAVLRRV